MSRNCNPPGPSASCVPGCSGGEQWCEIAPTNYCPWGQGHLRDMVQQHLWHGAQSYNEVIIDAQVLEQNAPYSIEAVFSLGNADQVRTTQQLLVDHFGVSSGVIPLLSLNVNDGQAPFRVI